MQIVTTIAVLLASFVAVSQAAKCLKCESTQNDCKDAQCEDAWCTVSISENKATGKHTVSKGCSPTNPTGGKDDGCVKDTASDGTENYRCACKTGETCNSEAGISRMLAMLNNQFSLPGQPGAPGAAAPFPGGPQPGAGGQPPNGQLPQVPTNFVNPNSTFVDVLSGQPNPFNGQPPQPGQPLQPGQPQPGQLPPGQPQPGANPGGIPPQPNASSPIGAQPNGQFPPPNNQQPFPQGPGVINVPPSSPNKPNGLRPGAGSEPETGFATLPGGAPPPNSNSIDIHTSLGNESSRLPGDGRTPPPTNDLSAGAQGGQSRSGSINAKSGARTCACTEPACSGPCKGEVCYMMAFSANDVHNQAFAGKQGQILQSGCTDDASVLAEGSHHAQRQIPNYRFKINGQEITVPASATYCNDGDYCNGAMNLHSKYLALIAGLTLALTFLIRF